MIKEIYSENFAEEVLNSELPVVVDFNAKWCGPCRKMMPMLEELSETYSDKIKFVKVDADNNKISLGNVEFDLYSNELKKIVGTYYTDANGEITVNIEKYDIELD